jgi:hypothetical protein
MDVGALPDLGRLDHGALKALVVAQRESLDSRTQQVEHQMLDRCFPKCPLKNKWTLHVSVVDSKAVLLVPIIMEATYPRRYHRVSFEVAVTKEKNPARWNRKLTAAFSASAPML